MNNTTNYHLLPVPVSVFMDQAYVSKTMISDIDKGDTFRCTLGIDTSTRVSHNLTSALEATRALALGEKYKTVKYTSTMIISNRHVDKNPDPITIIEKSSVPISLDDDARIKVFLTKPAGLANSENGMEVDLKRDDGFKVKWSSGSDETKGLDGKKEGDLFGWAVSLLGRRSCSSANGGSERPPT